SKRSPVPAMLPRGLSMTYFRAGVWVRPGITALFPLTATSNAPNPFRDVGAVLAEDRDRSGAPRSRYLVAATGFPLRLNQHDICDPPGRNPGQIQPSSW